MKNKKIKKMILGAVVIAIVLSCGTDIFRPSIVDAATQGNARTSGGKIPQKNFKLAELDILFVLDNSGSMRSNDPNFITREVVTNFVSDLGERARLGMVISSNH